VGLQYCEGLDNVTVSSLIIRPLAGLCVRILNVMACEDKDEISRSQGTVD
jgi:hypothetical protein